MIWWDEGPWSPIHHIQLPERKVKVSPTDFRIVNNFIDSVAPESESKSNPDIKKARRAWAEYS